MRKRRASFPGITPASTCGVQFNAAGFGAAMGAGAYLDFGQLLLGVAGFEPAPPRPERGALPAAHRPAATIQQATPVLVRQSSIVTTPRWTKFGETHSSRPKMTTKILISLAFHAGIEPVFRHERAMFPGPLTLQVFGIRGADSRTFRRPSAGVSRYRAVWHRLTFPRGQPIVRVHPDAPTEIHVVGTPPRRPKSSLPGD